MEYNGALSILYSVLLLTSRSFANIETVMPNEYMVCKPVAGVYATLNGEKDGLRGLHPVLKGPPGAAGAPGSTGVTGPGGEPDYKKVATLVVDKMTQVNARIYKLEQELKKLKSGAVVTPTGQSPGLPVPTQSAEDVKNAQECLEKYHSPMHYGSMCYNVIGGDGLRWDFAAAESNCTKLGGYPADLNSRAVYNLIYNYVDQTYSTVVQAWTGMRYEKDKLLKTDGAQANFVKWMAYNPRKSRSSYSSYYRTYTYVYVNIDTSSRTQGMQNTPLTRKLSYAICHYDLTGATTRRSTTSETTTRDAYDSDDDYYD